MTSFTSFDFIVWLWHLNATLLNYPSWCYGHHYREISIFTSYLNAFLWLNIFEVWNTITLMKQNIVECILHGLECINVQFCNEAYYTLHPGLHRDQMCFFYCWSTNSVLHGMWMWRVDVRCVSVMMLDLSEIVISYNVANTIVIDRRMKYMIK